MITIRAALDSAEVDAAYDLAARVFGADYESSRITKARQRELDPVDDVRDVVVAADDREIVGLVRIVNRIAYADQTRVKVGGITSVAVRADLQGKGYGRRLMEAAIERSTERGDALSVAFARRAVDGFYWALGYVGIAGHPEVVADTSSRRSPEIAAVARGFDGRFADVYADAYRHSYAPLCLSFERDSAWWRSGRKRIEEREPAWIFWTVGVGGTAVGYFVVRQKLVIEAAALPGREADVFGALAEFSGRELHLRLPGLHWAVEAARALPHRERTRFSWNGGHIVRVLEPKAPLSHAAARGTLLKRLGIQLRDDDEKTRWFEGRTPLESMPVWSPIDEF